jgi:hypothetical protein
MVSNRGGFVAGLKVPRVFPVLLFLTAVNFYCFSSEKSLPGITGQGQVSGTVVGATGTPILDVTVTTSFKGQTLSTKTDKNGKFSFSIPDVERGDGFTLAFAKTDFDNTNAAAVIKLPNLKVDVGSVTMMIRGSEGTVTRTITGQFYDNFSYGALKSANVSLTDASGQVIVAQTNDAGKFTLQSAYFPLNASYTLSVYKANYIPRTDLTVQVSAEENTMDNSPARLYNRFGSVYVYVGDDTRIDTATNKPYSVDGAALTIMNSNNKLLTCISSVGKNPSGPYDAIAGVPNPLPVGTYCPDLTGITSPMSMALPYTGAAARTNNSGGVKFQNDFLFIGNRYTVNISKTSANCTSRANTAGGCYRAATSYVDMGVTGDNPIPGSYYQLKWDSWIHGTARVKDPYTPANVCTASNGATNLTSCPGASCHCTLSGIAVKLYDDSNTYLTETTTDTNGRFVFDTPIITRGSKYRLEFEKNGVYSRTRNIAPNWLDGATQCDQDYTTQPQSWVRICVPSNPVTTPPAAPAAQNYGNGANSHKSDSCSGGAICLNALPPPTHCVRGTVKDYWSTLPVPGATISIYDGGWRTGTTGPSAAAGPIPALAAGEFYIQGNFANTAVNAYDVEISKTGYTGSTQVAKQTFKFTHDGVAACPATPYNLDTQNACGATGVGPTGGNTCVSSLVLYPIGIHAVLNGGSKSFNQQVKQTYEKFLTEKNGLTISGRTGTLQLTSGPQKSDDHHGIYLHFDSTPFAFSDRADTKWSNNVPVNPLPTKCTPTVTANCSPRANGVITESIGNDNRIISWDIKTYTYYHFYAAAPGAYTVETTGSTDTKITLISQTGAVEGSDDDSGSGSNARIAKNLLRGWYYIKVEGKNNNVFGFFDVSVTGPAQAESNYVTMLSPMPPSQLVPYNTTYQTLFGTTTYATNCAPNNGNLVISWYDAVGHMLYVAAPGENGGCSVNATIEKHGPIGEIIRGHFSGSLRPIAPSGANATISAGGFYNIIRQE